MNIHSLMFGWEYPPLSLGGLGVACQGLAEGLTTHNVKITLALPHNQAKPSNGIQIVTPTDTVIATDILEKLSIPSFLQPYDTIESYAERITRYQTQHHDMKDIYGKDLPEAIAYFTEKSIETTINVDANIIHTHDWMTYEAGIRAARYKDIPMVAHIHATELDRTHFQPNEWIYNTEKKGFNDANVIIAVSEYTKQILVDHYSIKADKIHVVHNGINPSNHQNDDVIKKEEMILFLGRLSLQKGAYHFLEMAAQVQKMRPHVQFVIAGAGEMLGELIDRSIELGLQNNVLFAGKVDSKEATILYKKASVFVMPSLSEPFGLVALEAALHKTPVILSKQSGASEVLEHCFKVDFWDTDRMADCALTLLREKELAAQVSHQSLQTVYNLHWNNQAQKVRTIYQSLC